MSIFAKNGGEVIDETDLECASHLGIMLSLPPHLLEHHIMHHVDGVNEMAWKMHAQHIYPALGATQQCSSSAIGFVRLMHFYFFLFRSHCRWAVNNPIVSAIRYQVAA